MLRIAPILLCLLAASTPAESAPYPSQMPIQSSQGYAVSLEFTSSTLTVQQDYTSADGNGPNRHFKCIFHRSDFGQYIVSAFPAPQNSSFSTISFDIKEANQNYAAAILNYCQETVVNYVWTPFRIEAVLNSSATTAVAAVKRWYLAGSSMVGSSEAKLARTGVSDWVDYSNGWAFIRIRNDGDKPVRFLGGSVYNCRDVGIGCFPLPTGAVIGSHQVYTATAIGPWDCTNPSDPADGLGTDAQGQPFDCNSPPRQPTFSYTYQVGPV